MNLTLRNFTSALLIAAATLAAAHAVPQKSIQTGGIQVTEAPSAYIVTIPSAANLSLRMEGHALRLTIADPATGIQLEQNVSLPSADTTRPPSIEQKDGNLTITVAKTTGSPASNAPSTALVNPNPSRLPSPSAPPAFSGTSPGTGQDIGAQIQAMQQRMNQLLSATLGSAFADDPFFNSSAAPSAQGNSSRHSPHLDSFAPFGGLNAANSGMASATTDIQDQGQNYIVRAKVPESAANDLNITIDNGTTLRITAKNEHNSPNSYSSSNVTQVLSLPGPVQADKMQVENKNGDLTITLPKA